MGKILAVKTDTLFPDGIWEGFREQPPDKILKLIEDNKEFIERAPAEEDESYQQIIPQIILKVANKIFIHKIPQTGSESRLHDMWPIVLGGHVEETDLDITSASQREFDEEVNYKGKIINREFLGLVKRHDVPVNKVHIGLVWLFEGDSEEIEMTNDDGVVEGRFIEINQLNAYLDKMTYWSQTITPYLIKRFS